MRDQRISGRGAQLGIGTEAERAWLELAPGDDGEAPLTVRLGEGELLLAIEALAMAYADLCGARPDSLARGVNRTLCNRTRAARARRAGDPGRRGQADQEEGETA